MLRLIINIVTFVTKFITALIFCLIWLVIILVLSRYDDGTRKYKTDIKVIVTQAYTNHWYASGHHWTADIEVFSEEYMIGRSLHLINAEAMEAYDTKVGDILDATMVTVVDENDDMVNRYISNVKF